MKQLIIFFIILSVTVGAYAQRKPYPQSPEEKYTTGLFKSDNAYALVPENDPSAASAWNVFQYLQGRVPGLMVYGAHTLTPGIIYRMGVPALFIDEIRVSPQTLATINMNDIAYIKIFRPPFMGSFGGSNGAIAVYTKEGEDEGEEE